MLTPIGALPPLPLDEPVRADGAPPLAFALQYGHWRYNADDSGHENAGLTVARRIGRTRSQVLLTGLYIAPPCGACSAWGSAGLELRSTLWRGESRRTGDVDPDGRLAAALGFRVTAAAARYLGPTYAAARSAAAAVTLGSSVRLTRGIRLTAAALPGVGVGSVTSEDETGRGARTMLGGMVGGEFGRHVVVDAAAQRITLPGGPTQLGVTVAWQPR